MHSIHLFLGYVSFVLLMYHVMCYTDKYIVIMIIMTMVLIVNHYN